MGGRHRTVATDRTGDPSMPHVASSAADLLAQVSGALHLEHDRVVIDDPARLRGEAIRDIAWTAAFGSDEGAVAVAPWLGRGGRSGCPGGRRTPGEHPRAAPPDVGRLALIGCPIGGSAAVEALLKTRFGRRDRRDRG